MPGHGDNPGPERGVLLTRVAAGDTPALAAAAIGRVYALNWDGPRDGPIAGPIDGTSFAAPLASGVAALLWTMDPSLAAAEVKDYILEGARVKRVDPSTGDSVSRSDIGVAGIYHLDAYGSVTLLAQRRSATPVCAFPVSLNSDNSGLVFERSVQLVQNISIASGAHDVAVAQGGRRMAIVVGNDPTNPVHEFRLQNGSWVDGGTVPGVYSRRYLERDTVDFGFPPSFMSPDTQWVRIRRKNGTEFTFHPYLELEPSVIDYVPTGWITLSPTGEHAVIGGSYTYSHSCPFMIGQRWYLMSLPSLAKTVITSDIHDSCAGPAIVDDYGTVAWKADGRAFSLGMVQSLFSSPGGTSVWRTRLMEASLSGSSFGLTRDLQINNRFVAPYGYLADEALIGAHEEVMLGPFDFECHLTSRPSQNLTTVTKDSLLSSCGMVPPVVANSLRPGDDQLAARSGRGTAIPSRPAKARGLGEPFRSRRSQVN